MKYTSPNTLCFALVILTLGASAFAEKPAPEPGIIHEPVEWSVVRCTGCNKTDKPRVLLIGDSIVQGYYPLVEKAMSDTAYCSQWTTAYSVCDPVYFQELEIMLKQYRYNVILFNPGLHGLAYTEGQYAEGMHKMLKILLAEGRGAKLIWASCTPLDAGNPGYKDQVHVIKRNKIAAESIAREDIPIIDLYALCISKPELYLDDRLHFADSGKEVQAKVVTEALRKLLASTMEKGSVTTESGAAKPLKRSHGPEGRQPAKK